MSVPRRASLPGADELFRSTTRPPGEPETAKAPEPDRPDSLRELIRFAADADRIRGDLPPEVGSLLAWLTVGSDAKHIVAVDTADAVGWLLHGLRGNGMLTSIIGNEGEHARARSAVDAAGASDHVRAILGSATDVLPRLSDASYDVVVWNGATDRPREAREHALRLLRPGGMIVVLGIRADDRLVRELIDDPRLRVTVLPNGEGLALARRD